MAATFIDGYLIEWWWQQEVRLKFAEPRPSTFFLLPTSLFVYGLDNNIFFIVNEGALRRFHLYFRLGCTGFLNANITGTRRAGNKCRPSRLAREASTVEQRANIFPT